MSNQSIADTFEDNFNKAQSLCKLMVHIDELPCASVLQNGMAILSDHLASMQAAFDELDRKGRGNQVDQAPPPGKAQVEQKVNSLELSKLMPSMNSDYRIDPGTDYSDLLDDSTLVLGTAIELLNGIAEEMDEDREQDRRTTQIYGTIYLFDIAYSTLTEGHRRTSRLHREAQA